MRLAHDAGLSGRTLSADSAAQSFTAASPLPLRLRLVGLVGAGVTAGGSSVTGVGGGVLGRDSTDCMEAVDTCRERAVLSLFKV